MNASERKLVKALRSGKYQQADGSLRPSENAFCCLGVACDISKKGNWRMGAYEGEKDYLPESVMNWLKWNNKAGLLSRRVSYKGRKFQKLDELNDAGCPFSKIADYIEKGLVKKVEKVTRTKGR